MRIYVGQASNSFKFQVSYLRKRLKKIINKKCGTNAKEWNKHLIGKKARMAGNIIIYK